MRILWWVGLVATIVVLVVGVGRLEYQAWVSGAIAVAAAIPAMVFLRFTADRVMGVTTEA